MPLRAVSAAERPSSELRTSSSVGDVADLIGDFIGDFIGDGAHVTIDGSSFIPVNEQITNAGLPSKKKLSNIRV